MELSKFQKARLYLNVATRGYGNRVYSGKNTGLGDLLTKEARPFGSFMACYAPVWGISYATTYSSLDWVEDTTARIIAAALINMFPLNPQRIFPYVAGGTGLLISAIDAQNAASDPEKGAFYRAITRVQRDDLDDFYNLKSLESH